MNETHFNALRQAAARTEGRLEGLLQIWDNNQKWFSSEEGLEFLKNKIEESVKMLNTARLTR